MSRSDLDPVAHIDDQSLRILLIEEDSENARFLRDLLANTRGMTFTVVCTTHLATGLAVLAADDTIDVILADLKLPDSQGCDTVIQVRALAPDIPIVVLTAIDEEETAVQAVSAGAQDYLVKEQIDKNLLTRTIRYAVECAHAGAERVRLLAQVQAQAQQTSGVLDTVPVGVLLLDQEGRVLSANPIGMRDLAWLSNAVIGDRVTHLGERPLVELFNSAPKGPWREIRAGHRIFEVIARPVVVGDATMGSWVLVIDDVTYSRSIHDQLQQQERLAAVGQLAAGIAHDFNNILAIIALQASMAMDTPDLAESVRKRLSIIGEQTAGATTLIQQILDFGRRAVLERRLLDLISFLQEQVELLTRTLPESILVSLACEPGNYVVRADPTRIQQMVMNLAVNARNAMPQGGTLRLTMAHQETPPKPGLPDGRWIRLAVADSGIGIAPEALAHIFEPFYTTQPQGRGTGLGLAQVYGIVKQHGGEIDVQSSPGEGATFTIYFPALAEAAPDVEKPQIKPPTGCGATILLVEDNAALLDAMSDILEMLGYGVVRAANGNEALSLLEEYGNGIALVLTDLVMPQMGGSDLLAAMRDRGFKMPAVVLSGHPLEGELDRLKALGVTGWLMKPPDIQELAQLLVQALEG